MKRLVSIETLKKYPAAGYFILCLGWSWLFWGLIILSGRSIWTYKNLSLFAIGGLGPMMAGIYMTGIIKGRKGLNRLGNRIVDPQRIKGRWWWIIVLLFPLVTLIATLINNYLPALQSGNALNTNQALHMMRRPWELLYFMGFVLLLGPLPEEIGWRGFALDALQKRWNALLSSLILGIVWATWHIPLFFIKNYFSGTGYSPNPIQYMYDIIIVSILFTWIYNHSNFSILAAILFHFMLNFTGEFLEPSVSVRLIQSALLTLSALIIVLTFGPHKLCKTKHKKRVSRKIQSESGKNIAEKPSAPLSKI